MTDDVPENPAASDATAGAVVLAGVKACLDEHPYGTVDFALGIGYALGGGIITPLTSRIVRLGLRVGLRTTLVPILTERITALTEEFIRNENAQGAGGTT